jgi:hypothetical protein
MKRLAWLGMAPGLIWVLRACSAIALTVASFVALRNRYHGGCLIPDYDLPWFLILPTLFLIGFIWAVSELVYPWLLLKGMRRLRGRLVSIALGLTPYVAVACVACALSPVPVDIHDNWFRAFTSGFWSVGFLAETGNFSHYSCGY